MIKREDIVSRVNGLSLCEVTAVNIMSLIMLPVWVCVLYVDRSSLIGWGIALASMVPTLIIAGFWDIDEHL